MQMKDIVVSWIMLLALVVLFCINCYMVKSVSGDISSEIETVKAAIESNDINRAEKIFKAAEEKWQKQLKKLLYVYPHTQLEEVSRVIFLSGHSLHTGDLENAHLRLSEVQYLLKVLGEHEKITLDNIF